MEKIIEATISIFSISAIRYFILAGIPFALFYLLMADKLAKFKIQQKLATKEDFVREVWHSMQSTLVFSIIAAALVFTPLRQYTRIYTDINDFPIWYVGVMLILSLIIHDTYFYWMHRLLHHKKLFKLAHLVHHKSTNPSPWTSYSFHILEAITEGLVLVAVVMLLPMHPLTILLFTVIGFIINVYGHLGYEIMPKGFRSTWAFEILNSSVHHNLHHSKFKGNYGLYFRIWDRVMGTEHPDYVKEYDRLQAQRFNQIPQEGTIRS
ncbi:Sterol desaturase/sphingolipid hydroxylase, fatty acid hydroxylase superfamily [Pedobacter terrae]|uniref:Sterol desaturase/sphingolipid hydroxylase, fatty acid hydroxylase superfamily n=1 Tax=Pedobacter terrae TaxID=405671 RepID=A0A1G7PYT3_9SPHI|nr:sterol desaturase family protein [Pedobacter terrae]SDF91383.1 Sterol desaturase/sphingolipid hydroxylase, fatty acid hydroxylase superfamily [Pedobacter terrae]